MTSNFHTAVVTNLSFLSPFGGYGFGCVCFSVCLSVESVCVLSYYQNKQPINLYMGMVRPKEFKINFGKYLDYTLDIQKSGIFKDPIFNIYSLTMAFWLTLLQN